MGLGSGAGLGSRWPGSSWSGWVVLTTPIHHSQLPNRPYLSHPHPPSLCIFMLGPSKLSQLYGERFSPNEGRVKDIYGEPKLPNKRACFRYIVNRNRQMRGLFNTYHEPLSPNDGACLTCMLNRYRQLSGGGCSRYRMTLNYQIGGVLEIYGEPEPPNQGRSSDIYGSRYMMNRNIQMRGRG